MPVEPYGGEMDLEGGWDYENRMVEPATPPRTRRWRTPAPPHVFGVHRPGQGQGKPENLHRGGQKPEGIPGPRAALRPAGPGKTTLAGIVANELGVNLRITSGPAIEKPGIWRPCSPI